MTAVGSTRDVTDEVRLWWVYLLRCEGDRLYCGITLDVEARFEMHRKGGGGRFTRTFRPLEIVYREGPYPRPDALRREMRIKKMRRRKKDELVAGTT